jgi:hypothetical protein
VDWVERIPFSETRNYVQRVMENLQVYRQRFGENTATVEANLHRAATAGQQSERPPLEPPATKVEQVLDPAALEGRAVLLRTEADAGESGVPASRDLARWWASAGALSDWSIL